MKTPEWWINYKARRLRKQLENEAYLSALFFDIAARQEGYESWGEFMRQEQERWGKKHL